MNNKFWNVLIAVLLVRGALMTASPVSARGHLASLNGVVYAVDTAGSTLTVTPQKGAANVVLKVDSTTSIKRNGRPATLADLQVGDLVVALYDQATLHAVNIFAFHFKFQ